MTSTVAVKRVSTSVQDAVSEAMELADWHQHLDLARPVLLKPNLGWDNFLPGAVTSPSVMEAVIRVLQPHCRDLRVVEADQVLVRCAKAFRQTRLDRVCQRYGVPFVNLSHEPMVTVDLGGEVFPQARLPKLLLEGNIVTVPVMKTHDKTVITGALKNQWGCLDKARHMYHLVVSQAIVELNLALRPKFAVMDATISLDGNGPKSGRPRVTDLVLSSGDLVALDSVAARLMGFDPAEIEHISLAGRAGLGSPEREKIRLVGDTVEEVNFAFRRARSNLVSVVERRLRRSRFKRFFFEGPLFWLACRGALAFYFFWYNLIGRRLKNEILAHPFYGPQWR
jgi:uncharacterized protein (DUF362 family)